MSGTAYSPWIWSEDYQRHYCYRTDEQGQVHYLWSAPSTSPTLPEPAVTSSSGPTASTPRTTNSYSVPTSAAPAYSPPTAHYTYLPPTPQPILGPLPEEVQRSVGGDLPRRYIRTAQDDNNAETLDPNFRRVVGHHYPYFFKRGRVFKMLWTEPAGRDVPGGTRGSTHFSLVKFGQTAYSEIRRFVVIQNKGTFSQCIPIQTYRRQGARKRGLVVEDHAIIYTGDEDDEPPPLLEGEEITKQALRVESTRGELLDKESRINFGKPYAVEHNCKVMDIGVVADEHIHLLINYFVRAMGIP